MAVISNFKHTTSCKAAAVLALVKAKHSYRFIEEEQHVSMLKINRSVAHARAHPEDPITTRLRCRRPRTLSDREKRRLVQDSVQDRECTMHSLCRKYRCLQKVVLVKKATTNVLHVISPSLLPNRSKPD